jgi:hypothetical protein
MTDAADDARPSTSLTEPPLTTTSSEHRPLRHAAQWTAMIVLVVLVMSAVGGGRGRGPIEKGDPAWGLVLDTKPFSFGTPRLVPPLHPHDAYASCEHHNITLWEEHPPVDERKGPKDTSCQSDPALSAALWHPPPPREDRNGDTSRDPHASAGGKRSQHPPGAQFWCMEIAMHPCNTKTLCSAQTTQATQSAPPRSPTAYGPYLAMHTGDTPHTPLHGTTRTDSHTKSDITPPDPACAQHNPNTTEVDHAPNMFGTRSRISPHTFGADKRTVLLGSTPRIPAYTPACRNTRPPVAAASAKSYSWLRLDAEGNTWIPLAMGGSSPTPHKLAICAARQDKNTPYGLDDKQASHSHAAMPSHDAPMHTRCTAARPCTRAPCNTPQRPGQNNTGNDTMCTKQQPPWGEGQKGREPPCCKTHASMQSAHARPCTHVDTPTNQAPNSHAAVPMPPPPTLRMQVSKYSQQVLAVGVDAGLSSGAHPSGPLLSPTINPVTTNGKPEWKLVFTFDPTNAADVNAAAAIGCTLARTDKLETVVWRSDYASIETGSPAAFLPGDVPTTNGDWDNLGKIGHVVDLLLTVHEDGLMPLGPEAAVDFAMRVLTHFNRVAENSPGLAPDDLIHMLNVIAARTKQNIAGPPGTTLDLRVAFNNPATAMAWHGVSLYEATATDDNGHTISISVAPHANGAEGNKELAIVLVVPAATAKSPAAIKELVNHLATIGGAATAGITGKTPPNTPDPYLLPVNGHQIPAPLSSISLEDLLTYVGTRHSALSLAATGTSRKGDPNSLEHITVSLDKPSDYLDIIAGLAKNVCRPNGHTPYGYPHPGAIPVNDRLVGNLSGNAGNNTSGGTNSLRFYTADKGLGLGGGFSNNDNNKGTQGKKYAAVVHSLALTLGKRTDDPTITISAKAATLLLADKSTGPAVSGKMLRDSTIGVMNNMTRMGTTAEQLSAAAAADADDDDFFGEKADTFTVHNNDAAEPPAAGGGAEGDDEMGEGSATLTGQDQPANSGLEYLLSQLKTDQLTTAIATARATAPISSSALGSKSRPSSASRQGPAAATGTANQTGAGVPARERGSSGGGAPMRPPNFRGLPRDGRDQPHGGGSHGMRGDGRGSGRGGSRPPSAGEMAERNHPPHPGANRSHSAEAGIRTGARPTSASRDLSAEIQSVSTDPPPLRPSHLDATNNTTPLAHRPPSAGWMTCTALASHTSARRRWEAATADTCDTRKEPDQGVSTNTTTTGTPHAQKTQVPNTTTHTNDTTQTTQALVAPPPPDPRPGPPTAKKPCSARLLAGVPDAAPTNA